MGGKEFRRGQLDPVATIFLILIYMGLPRISRARSLLMGLHDCI